MLVTQLCLTLCDPMGYSPPGSSVHGDSPGKNTRVDCHALLQGIFPTQGSNPGLPHWGQILYHLSHQESPRILEWLAMPSSRGSSQPRDWTPVSYTSFSFIGRHILYHWANKDQCKCQVLWRRAHKAEPWAPVSELGPASSSDLWTLD